MPNLNPFVSLFVAVATLNVGMFVWLRADIARVDAGLRTELVGVRDGLALTNERLARVETVQSEQSERLARLEAGQNALRGDLAATNARLTRIEATLSEHGQRMGGLEAGQAEVRGELTATNERMARVEGTVAGALGRPFPERMAQAPEPETGADG